MSDHLPRSEPLKCDSFGAHFQHPLGCLVWKRRCSNSGLDDVQSPRSKLRRLGPCRSINPFGLLGLGSAGGRLQREIGPPSDRRCFRPPRGSSIVAVNTTARVRRGPRVRRWWPSAGPDVVRRRRSRFAGSGAGPKFGFRGPSLGPIGVGSSPIDEFEFILFLPFGELGA